MAGYVSVFSLGLNSRNINNGNYGWAATTSLFIGLSQAMIWNKITAPEAGILEALIYSLSGAAGATSSMWFHKRYINKNKT